MRRLASTLTAAFFVLGSSALVANAQPEQGAASLHGLAQNATPIHKAACGGWGPYCPPGRVRRCGPYRCWCAPCW